MPSHYHHQEIARLLQNIKSPSTIPYVKQALENGFDYLDYTGSDSDAITKWFSWLLASIGTPDAIAVIEHYTHSNDPGVSKEMTYRLNKINH